MYNKTIQLVHTSNHFKRYPLTLHRFLPLPDLFNTKTISFPTPKATPKVTPPPPPITITTTTARSSHLASFQCECPPRECGECPEGECGDRRRPHAHRGGGHTHTRVCPRHAVLGSPRVMVWMRRARIVYRVEDR